MVRIVKIQLMKWARTQPLEDRKRWCYKVSTIARQGNSRFVESILTSPAKAMLGFNTLRLDLGVDGLDNLDTAAGEADEHGLILTEEYFTPDAR